MLNGGLKISKFDWEDSAINLCVLSNSTPNSSACKKAGCQICCNGHPKRASALSVADGGVTCTVTYFQTSSAPLSDWPLTAGGMGSLIVGTPNYHVKVLAPSRQRTLQF